MNMKPVSGRTRVLVLGVLTGCASIAGTALAAPPASAGGGSNGRVTTQAAASPGGYDLDYFHADRASRTYAIRLQNGTQAEFDFDNGTATLYVSGMPTILPLDQVLIEANGGDVQAASAMYDQMYRSISAPNSDAIMALKSTQPFAHTQTFGGPFDPPPIAGSIGNLDLGLWSMPAQGQCWPLPSPCQKWGGGLTNTKWDNYNNWWSSPYGTPPPTPQPPNPYECPPGDNNCVIHETRREDACNSLGTDQALTAAALITAGKMCADAARTRSIGKGVACGGSLLGAGALNFKYLRDQKTCRTPYPGGYGQRAVTSAGISARGLRTLGSAVVQQVRPTGGGLRLETLHPRRTTEPISRGRTCEEMGQSMWWRFDTQPMPE